MLKGKTVAPLTLGCKVNQYETDGMIELLKEAGMTAVSFEEKADVYLINTCSVTNMADKKSRQMIHRARSTTSTTAWPRPSACSSGRCCKRTAPMRGATTWPTRSRAAAAPSPNC